jgi:ketosteroid isomerase-like protein
MSEHPNATLARRMTEAMDAGDRAAAAAFLADDVVWHEIGRAEPRHGKAELAAGMAEMDYTITATIHDVVADDEHTVLLADATATRKGRTLHYRVAEIYHFRDGKVRERWAFSDDTAAITDFFA